MRIKKDQMPINQTKRDEHRINLLRNYIVKTRCNKRLYYALKDKTLPDSELWKVMNDSRCVRHYFI